jgi:oxygen-independent coproporphyrinogen-3 oxidase
MAALTQELQLFELEWPTTTLETIFVGGGTPTVLSLDQLSSLLSSCHSAFDIKRDAEITIEANPGTLDKNYLRSLRELGINRLSLGVQSFDDALLKRLGRLHSASQAIKIVDLARQTGWANINLDLMYGLPGQSMTEWLQTLEQALSLEPEHLSLYALTLHESTPLAQQIKAGRCASPDDDLAADMYLEAVALLAQAGYVHYEISNWARATENGSAYKCQHNLNYWLDRRYFGVGAGAHGYLADTRYWNVAHPRDYIERIKTGQRPIAGEEEIDLDTEISEFMILGLRRIVGVYYETFVDRFGFDLCDLYQETIAELERIGLLIMDQEGIRLTKRGYLLGNEAFQRFLLDRESEEQNEHH